MGRAATILLIPKSSRLSQWNLLSISENILSLISFSPVFCRYFAVILQLRESQSGVTNQMPYNYL